MLSEVGDVEVRPVSFEIFADQSPVQRSGLGALHRSAVGILKPSALRAVSIWRCCIRAACSANDAPMLRGYGRSRATTATRSWLSRPIARYRAHAFRRVQRYRALAAFLRGCGQ